MAISGTLSDANIVKMSNAVVSLDVGAVDTWVDVESWANTVTPTRGTATIGEMKTLDGSNHVSASTIGSARVRVVMIFTDIATDPFVNLYAQVGELVDVRWSQSDTAAEQRFYTASAFLLECTPPGWDSNSGEPCRFEFEIGAADILNEVISA